MGKKITVSELRKFVQEAARRELKEARYSRIDRSVDVDSLPAYEEDVPNSDESYDKVVKFLRKLGTDSIFDGSAYEALTTRLGMNKSDAQTAMCQFMKEEGY